MKMEDSERERERGEMEKRVSEWVTKEERCQYVRIHSICSSFPSIFLSRFFLVSPSRQLNVKTSSPPSSFQSLFPLSSISFFYPLSLSLSLSSQIVILHPLSSVFPSTSQHEHTSIPSPSITTLLSRSFLPFLFLHSLKKCCKD